MGWMDTVWIESLYYVTGIVALAVLVNVSLAVKYLVMRTCDCQEGGPQRANPFAAKMYDREIAS